MHCAYWCFIGQVRDCPPGMSANKRKVEEDKTKPEK